MTNETGKWVNVGWLAPTKAGNGFVVTIEGIKQGIVSRKQLESVLRGEIKAASISQPEETSGGTA